MRIGTLAFTGYDTVGPYDPLSQIQDDLARNKFLVVKEGEKFIGILSLADAVINPHKLVIDCLTEKTAINYEGDLKEALAAFEKHSQHVLPVFRGNAFFGVLRYKDILDYLHEQNMKLAVDAEKIGRYESLSLLAAGVGHDFNNVLTAAFGQIGLALDYTDVNQKVRELLESVESGLLRARDLTQQLLTFSLEGKFAKEICDVSAFAQQTVPFFLKGTNVEARFDFPADLAPAEVDIRQFSQVLSNLTINALQAMPQGGMLTISGRNYELNEDSSIPPASGRYLKLSIQDTGIGIDKEDLPRIFEPYVTTKPGGSGLGLAIVYSIIRRHNGFIEVDSELGKGTRFDIYLPAAR